MDCIIQGFVLIVLGNLLNLCCQASNSIQTLALVGWVATGWQTSLPFRLQRTRIGPFFPHLVSLWNLPFQMKHQVPLSIFQELEWDCAIKLQANTGQQSSCRHHVHHITMIKGTGSCIHAGQSFWRQGADSTTLTLAEYTDKKNVCPAGGCVTGHSGHQLYCKVQMAFCTTKPQEISNKVSRFGTQQNLP